MTPPGSGCSLGFGSGLPVYDAIAAPIRNLHLVVQDIETTVTELHGRGIEVGSIGDVGGGVRYASFADPDGNGLLLQEMGWRTGGDY